MQLSKDMSERIIDPKSYANWDIIDDAFRELRRDAPLAQAHVDEFDPFWVVTRFDDIQAIEKQNDLFHSGDKSPTLMPIKTAESIKEMMGGSPHMIRSLVQMDNPDHFKHRQLTQSWFMPQSLRKLEDRIKEIAKTFVDRMLAFEGECDFARDVAFLYPLHVVMEVIGVPEADEPRMLKLTQELFGAADPELARGGVTDIPAEERGAALAEIVADFSAYFTNLSEERRKDPKNDLATIIANAKIDDQPIGFLEALSYYIIAATAGHDTTSATTAGTLWALAERPDQFAKVKDDMSLIPSLVEESIRWETPVKHFMRTATEDTEVAGQKIAKDEYLMLCYPSGNRDESKFDKPFEFQVDRKPNKHVAFGYGAHICLGQHLARMEMRLLWEELLPRIKSVELNGTPARSLSNFVCGPKNVPIRFQAA